jgi:ATP-binding cassette, subfamily B, bacterial MsbA
MPLEPKILPSAEMPVKAIVRRIWTNYLATQKRPLGFALACAVVVALTTAVLGFWMGPAVDLLFQSPDANESLAFLPVEFAAVLIANPLLAVPLGIVMTVIIRFVAQRGLTVSLNKTGNRLVGSIQKDLFSRLVHADLGRLQSAHSGQHLSSVLYDADLVREAASTGVVQYVQSSLIVVGSMATMFYYDWTMTLAVLLVGPFIGLVMGRYLKRTRQAAQGAMAETSSLSTAIMESLDGIKVVKVSNQEVAEEARVGDVIERRQGHMIKGANARTMAAPATEVLTGLLLAGLLAYVGWRAQGNHITTGDLFGFLTALGIASQALRQLTGLQGTFSQGMTAARRLFQALDIKPEITTASDATALPRDFKTLSFDKASFAYGAAIPVLHEVSFEVQAGQSIALVGPSGSGKSTLLNLIPRFFDLSSGAIRFDGVDHRGISLASLRDNIALVTQDPFLFDEAIHANIAYGRPDATTAEIEQAARDAAADDFIRGLPQGYNTRAGEAGSQLSGGQKQRIAIARAFLKNTPLLLLDEATSALDTESEAQVQQALERLMKGRTTFVVAHRLSTVRNCDLILVLDKGQIREQGTHDSLMRTGGLYSRLAAAQLGTSPEAA